MNENLEAVKLLILTYKGQGLEQTEIAERVMAVSLNGCEEEALVYLQRVFSLDMLPDIVVTARPLRDISTHVLQVLYASNGETDGIYRRSGALARVTRDDEGRPIIEFLTESAFRGTVERKCSFMQEFKGQLKPTPPPMDVVRDCMSLGSWEFPSLVGITEAPVLRPDGTVLSTPGYDIKTRLYYAPAASLELGEVPEEPDEFMVAEAIVKLFEPLRDFPFDCDASRANAIAAMLTPILRPMIDGPVPFTIIDKPQPGTGASLLAELVSLIATGRPAAMMPAQHDDEAWKKAIVSLLIRGQQVVVIDNIDSTLWAPSLAAVLTATTYQDRILGRSEMILLPNRVTWIGTGNNIKLAGDLPRRAVWVRLDAKQARPWMRDPSQFQHPRLIEWLTENRGTLLRAMLTIARAWAVAGKPQPLNTPNLGGYEPWVRVIGGVLEYIKVPGFLSNLEALYARVDTETPQWEAFLETWHQKLGEQPVTVADLVSHFNEDSDFASTIPDTIGNHGDRGFTRKLGKALARREDVRYPNNLRLGKGQHSHYKVATWSVLRGLVDPQLPNPAKSERTAGFAEFDSLPTQGTEISSHMGTGGKYTPQTPQTPQTGEDDDDK